MKEIWKDIRGYEGYYQVSNLGNVKSLDREIKWRDTIRKQKGKMLKPRLDTWGIPTVILSLNNSSKQVHVSTLVFETFNSRKKIKNKIITFIDGNKENCKLDNLVAMSRTDRQKISYDEGKRYRIKLKYNNKIMTIKQLVNTSPIKGITEERIRQRLREQHWNVYEAVEVPMKKLNFYKKENKK